MAVSSITHRAALMTAASLVAALCSSCTSPVVDITFLDVGYGDAIVVRSDATTLVIDGGYGRDESDRGRVTLLPWLASNGVTRVDAVFCTHSHPDHVGGLCDLLAAVPVGAVYRPVWRQTNAYTVVFDELVRARGIPCHVVAAGTTATWDDIAVRVISPPPGGADVMPPPVDLNATSMALDLECGGARVLLLADITTPVQQQLLAQSNDWRADVLKIPHHAATDAFCPEFIAAVNPTHAVLSIGPNPYRNPADDVIAAYQACARVWRTDRDGHITLQCRGHHRVTPLMAGP